MEFKNPGLIALPFVLAVILLLGVTFTKYDNNISTETTLSSVSHLGGVTWTVCDCPTETSSKDCGNTEYPVLGGVDLVSYFTTLKLSDGTYDETQPGVAGSSEHSSTYNGYKYHFASASNKALFDASPSTYLPQYGGFCAWGVAGEFCPNPWSASCLGPDGSWFQWTIQNNKLYFFKFALAKSKFLSDLDDNVATADSRWLGWFGEDNDKHMNTKCYMSLSQARVYILTTRVFKMRKYILYCYHKILYLLTIVKVLLYCCDFHLCHVIFTNKETYHQNLP